MSILKFISSKLDFKHPKKKISMVGAINHTYNGTCRRKLLIMVTILHHHHKFMALKLLGHKQDPREKLTESNVFEFKYGSKRSTHRFQLIKC